MQPLPLPREQHSAIICGQTGGCGKIQFVLDELLHPDHGYYHDAFEVVFIAQHGRGIEPTWSVSGSGEGPTRLVFSLLTPGRSYTSGCGLSSESPRTRPRYT